MKKQLSKDDHLKAVALFTQANYHYVEGEKYLKALARHLGYDDQWGGCLGDAVLQHGAQAELALKEEGFRTVRSQRRHR